MKKAISIIFYLIVFLSLAAEPKVFAMDGDTALLSAPKVDRRVELLSIVFRLAGSREYNTEENKNYVGDIHRHFDKYKNHPLIVFAKELADSNGVGYDAIAAMAIHIEQAPSFKPLVPFSDSVPESRWGRDDANKFVSLLQKFYVDAECEKFFKEEENKYKIAEEKFRSVYDKLDLSWYKKFYGKLPDGKFNIVIGLGNGGNNYGPKIIYPNGKEEVYAVMGSWSFDSLGQPFYDIKNYLPILIHEFNHSFVNYLIDKNKKMFEEAGSAIYIRVSAKMRVQAYSNWKTMICEAIVRAAVIKYLKSHDTIGGKQADKETMDELSNGFVWMKEQVALLDKYESNRQKYPTLENFVPELASFYGNMAKNIDVLLDGYNNQCPKVVSIDQFKNSATDVDPKITLIKIKVDKALRGKGYSIGYGKKGKETYPTIGTITYSDNNKAIEIQVSLKPDTEYQFTLLGLSFKTPDGYPLQQYEVDFRTAK
ncbi:MAG TPA: DUF4932 domain-containing protein [Bacteroidia bacterium]|nr:DUF4932 domain-containing protein [Bacteroidia bacterium]